MALRLSGLQMGTIHCSYALMQAGQAQRPGKISGVYEYLTDDAPQEHFLWANGISYCSAPKTACRNDNTLQVQHPLTFCDSSRYASKEIPLDYFFDNLLRFRTTRAPFEKQALYNARPVLLQLSRFEKLCLISRSSMIIPPPILASPRIYRSDY